MNATDPARDEPKTSFFKVHVLPVLFIFLIPGFSAWFFSYAEGWMDRAILQQVEADVQSNGKLADADKTRILTFWREVPVSRIMASRNPEAAQFQAMFEPTKMRYATFRWMKRTAWICLATIFATFVIVGLSVAFSLRSQSAQYYALRIGWPVLRTSAAIQVLGQAVLAVALSFWVTAILMEVYVIKLILIIGVLAALAVFALFKAIFAKTGDQFAVAGALVSDTDAPRLWQRVRDMAARLDTAAPDRIIVGIQASFFVTEHPVVFDGQVLHGRSLYLSLPMLKVLAVDEADAVLGHELAHFSGQDTLWSRKISPLLGKFALYIQTLGAGLSVVVSHFMLLFWKLYGLSISRLSRAREFRADQIGVELVSAEAMKRALVKITCYCEYRAETEQAILKQARAEQWLSFSQQLEQGYPAFLSSFADSDRAIGEQVPHPFDSHPSLNSRLAQLGFEARAALRDRAIQQPAAESWYQAITNAPAMEEQMWADLQQGFQAAHRQHLAWTVLPGNEEETALVQEHFPHAAFRKKDGAEATLDFDRIHLAEWNAPILFQHIVNAQLEDTMTSKRLTLTHRQEGASAQTKTRFYPGEFTGETGDLLTLFQLYYGRHLNAQARRQ